MDIKMVEQEAEASLKEKDYDKCVSLLTPAVQSGHATPLVHKLYAEALYIKKDFARALPSFQVALTSLHNCPYSLHRKAGAAVGASNLSKEEQKRFWKDCSSSQSKQFSLSLNTLLKGDYDNAEILFVESLRNYFDNTASFLWQESFQCLKEALLGHAPTDVPPLPHTEKIFVSGMSWSGSSAFFDYFREFDDVVYLRGELSFIERGRCFKKICNAVGHRQQFRKACILFYYYSLLGQGEAQTVSDYNVSLKTKQLMKQLTPLAYAEKAKNVTLLIAHCIVEHEKCQGDIHTALCGLSESIIYNYSAKSIKSGAFILLDNAVHIGNLDVLKYINNITALCSFRDPRSQYTALLLENPAFNQTCEQFIEWYKIRREKASKAIDDLNSTIKSNGMNVSIQKIDFETFVLSESFRDNLAKSLGLDLSRRTKHAYFKPWESIRNVTIHQEHSVVEDIKRIETALPEYCYEPVTVRLPSDATTADETTA